MANNQLIGLVKDTPQILSMVYSDLAQPSVKKVGIALETVFEFSTAFLLPVKLLNERFKLNFEKNLNSYKEKIDDIAELDICEVNAQIGVPLIEKLSYTTNDEIAELFVNLLTKASSIKTVNIAHPSFVQLIDRLSVDEARIISYLIGRDFIPTITFRAHMTENNGFISIIKNATPIPFEVELLFPNNISTYIDNLTGMGLLDISHGLHKMDNNLYDSLVEKYDYKTVSKHYTDSQQFRNVEIKKSYYQITDLGKLFIRACTSQKNA